jgi:hypothetical protein
VDKLKTILLILAGLIAGILIGWFIWSGGEFKLKLATINVKVDSTFIPYTDTLIKYHTKLVYDTTNCIDTVKLVTVDTIYQFDINALLSSQKPQLLISNLYASLPFEYETTFYDKKDTILYKFKFPELEPFLSVRHGIDSILKTETVVYKDYWFDSWFVQVPIYCALFGAGAAINSGNK